MMQSTTALLVIDVQEGCFGHPEFEVYDADGFLGRLSRLIARARADGVPVVYLQHVGTSGHPLEEGTAGVEIHSRVAPAPGDIVVRKCQSDGFFDTTLEAELNALGVRELIVCGFQSEFCVDTTCRRAKSVGFNVKLVADGHTTVDTQVLKAEDIITHHNETLRHGFVTLVSTANPFGSIDGGS